MKLFSQLLATLTTLAFLPLSYGQSTFSIEKSDAGIRVMLDGELMTQYLTAAPSPILYPLVGPDGARMTRDFPMLETTEGEKHDHPHHRSMWFTHGIVNGFDFWQKDGRVVHESFGKVEGGSTAVIESTSGWIAPGEKRLLTEKRRMTFAADGKSRWIDFVITLSADADEVNFGDTKEGTFAVRVAGTMKVDAKLGGKITNSEGLLDGDAWGKPAKWVDYTGPINDKTYGIAMFCHPTSFNYPNRWHVRTYGLFAANPFGVQHFTGQAESTPGVTLKKGEELRFKYRILLHSGETDSQAMEKVFQEYSQPDAPKL